MKCPALKNWFQAFDELKEVDDLSVRNKKAAFRRETGTRKAVHVTYVTTFGLVRNAYANSVQSEVTLDDIFRP